MTVQEFSSVDPTLPDASPSVGLLDIATVLVARWRLLLVAPLLIGLMALGASYLMPLTFTAQTMFLPPQQQQSSAAAAVASLGALANLAGGGIKTSGDQYVSLLQSVNVEDRIVDKFGLIALYKVKHRFEARRMLERNVRITLGKKDGLITVEADATDPKLAADIANQYVSELQRLTADLALTEAKQRRVFFENELKKARTKMADAQQVLQSGGFDPGAMKTDPKASAESYGRIKAQVSAAEVRLEAMRRYLADGAPEMQQQLALLGALRGQLQQAEGQDKGTGDTDYVGRYREFRYQEALLELLTKQFEAARIDESRESASIQVVDVATPPELKSKPRRSFMAIAATLGSATLISLFLIIRFMWQRAKDTPDTRRKLEQLQRAWRG